MRLPFSDRAIAGLPFVEAGQQVIRDDDLPGFFLLIGKRSKSFMVQGDLWEGGKRRTLRVKIGDVGKVQTREARAKAKVLLGSISDGIDPRPQPKPAPAPKQNESDPTLKEAWARYRYAHLQRKARSNCTIENYRDHIERLMADWLAVVSARKRPVHRKRALRQTYERKWPLPCQWLHAHFASPL